MKIFGFVTLATLTSAIAIDWNVVGLERSGPTTPVCAQSDLLKCFESVPRLAPGYCSLFVAIKYPGKATTTVIVAAAGTSTVTSSVTSTSTSSKVTLITATATSTTLSFSVTTRTTTVTPVVIAAPRRQRRADSQFPACLKIIRGNPLDYQPEAQKSACACLGVTQSTRTVTSTVPARILTTRLTTIFTTVTSTSTSTVSTTTVTVTATGFSTVVSTTIAAAPTCPTEAIVNGGFETGSTLIPSGDGAAPPWAFTDNNVVPTIQYEGRYSLSYSGAAFASTEQSTTICPGRSYRLTLHYLSQSKVCQFTLFIGGIQQGDTVTPATSTTYSTYTIDYTAPAGSSLTALSNFRISNGCLGGGQGFFDAFSLTVV